MTPDSVWMVAWYFAAFLSHNDWPTWIGPYHTQEECWHAREAYEIMEYVTDRCELMVVSTVKEPQR